jgi:hypothetical protein
MDLSKFDILYGILFVWTCILVAKHLEKIDAFTSQIEVGQFYEAALDALPKNNKSKEQKAYLNKRTVFYKDGKWEIVGAKLQPNMAYKIWADGDPNTILFYRSPGEVNNLPANIGALPAHDKYIKIFNSRLVFLKIIPLEQAIEEANKLKQKCEGDTKCEDNYLL